eukprot:13071644-Alexandrium_andersonii.AAC.1
MEQSAWVEGGTAVERLADLGRPEQGDQVAGEEDEEELDRWLASEPADGVTAEIPVSQQRIVQRLHRNLGHPRPEELARALRHAGARPDVVAWAKRFRCEACKKSVRPLARRP